jgi:hypothetical protein
MIASACGYSKNLATMPLAPRSPIGQRPFEQRESKWSSRLLV